MNTRHTCLLLAVAGLLASCDKPGPSPTGSAPAPATPSAALKAVIDAAVVGDAKAIHVLREAARPGDTVTVSGQVMGNSRPFVEGRAAFVLGDPEVLTPCNENPDDACETPWDACCDTPGDKQRGTATIQVVGEDGRVLRETIEGIGGIETLAKLTVTGSVADGSTPDLLVINATAIDVEN